MFIESPAAMHPLTLIGAWQTGKIRAQNILRNIFRQTENPFPCFCQNFKAYSYFCLADIFLGFDRKDYSKIDYCKLKLIIGPKRNTQTGFFSLSFFGGMGMAMFWQFDIPWWWSNSRSAVNRECLKWIRLNLWICFHYILIPTLKPWRICLKRQGDRNARQENAVFK